MILVAPDSCVDAALEQVGCVGKVFGSECMGNGLMPEFLRCIPGRSASMQQRDLLWLARLQPRKQRLTEERVKAIPLPLFIERHQKQVGPLQGLQPFL